VVNHVMSPLARLGPAGRHTYILTLRGWKSGRGYSTLMNLIENDEHWLVAPYGDVGPAFRLTSKTSKSPTATAAATRR
jgi:hypothetical protein